MFISPLFGLTAYLAAGDGRLACKDPIFSTSQKWTTIGSGSLAFFFGSFFLGESKKKEHVEWRTQVISFQRPSLTAAY